MNELRRGTGLGDGFGGAGAASCAPAAGPTGLPRPAITGALIDRPILASGGVRASAVAALTTAAAFAAA